MTAKDSRRSQEPRRPHQCAPHVRRRRVVEAQAFLRLLEVATDQVDEIVELDLGIGVERIDVVHANEPRRHVVLVVAGALILFDDVGLGLIVVAEELAIEVGIGIADGLVREEAQRLVHADRPAHLLVDIGLDQLRAPVAVVAADEAHHADVVQKARQHHLLTVPGLARERRALQQVIGGREALPEEIDQLWLLRHLRQPRIGAHQEVLAGILRHQRGAAFHLDLAVAQGEQHRLGRDLLVELEHHALFELVRLFRKGQRLRGVVRHLDAPLSVCDVPCGLSTPVLPRAEQAHRTGRQGRYDL